MVTIVSVKPSLEYNQVAPSSVLLKIPSCQTPRYRVCGSVALPIITSTVLPLNPSGTQMLPKGKIVEKELIKIGVRVILSAKTEYVKCLLIVTSL